MYSPFITKERARDIRTAVKLKYRQVSANPDGHFPYCVGRTSAVRLGYDPRFLQNVPSAVVDRFVGVGNPFQIIRPPRGARVLDAGCGCGMDSFIAAQMVRAEGLAVGLDLSPEMLGCAHGSLMSSGSVEPSFLLGSIEALPFSDSFFDLVVSNGALNLVPDKTAAFSEIARVLRPGGALAVADLVLIDTLPPEMLADMDAWST